MGMLQVHQDAMDNAEIALHEFLLLYKGNQPIVYGLVEGKDDPHFYTNIVNLFLPEKWQAKLISAGDRANVIALLRSFDWSRFDKNRICFFVDRDLSFFLGEEFDDFVNLYVTDGYSIENELYRKENFHRIMRELYDIDLQSEEQIEKIDNLIDSNFELFKDVLSHVMAQIIFWKRNNCNAKIKSIEIDKFFSIENGVLIINEWFLSVEERLQFCCASVKLEPVDLALIQEIESEFAEKNGKDKFIRGKYILWLFVETLLSICRNFAKIIPEYAGKPKEKISVGFKNALLVFGNRVRYPDSLREFLQNNYASYIARAEVA